SLEPQGAERRQRQYGHPAFHADFGNNQPAAAQHRQVRDTNDIMPLLVRFVLLGLGQNVRRFALGADQWSSGWGNLPSVVVMVVVRRQFYWLIDDLLVHVGGRARRRQHADSQGRSSGRHSVVRDGLLSHGCSRGIARLAVYALAGREPAWLGANGQ